ncbi:MAG: succinate dehydrogenase, hydrophobic membrane anchor protein, partial [Alphaproteobacteria bacterium]|nr:succinate dehydrogenase, hydrophobic membrane anchor protein [Alphaproteobacteria bacterium]
MNQNEGLKSDLARVRGLGSAKSGTGHWVGMHYTSLALVPLGVWFAFSMFICIGTADYAAARAWFQS